MTLWIISLHGKYHKHIYTISMYSYMHSPTPAGAAVEPVYSTVMKIKPRKEKDATSIITSPTDPNAQESFAKEPEIVKVVPNPECYEPDRLDTSLVITNGSTFESSKDSITAPESPPPVPPYLPLGDDEDDTVIYEEVNRPDVNSAVYKDLKKREDVSNVHLMSIRGIYMIIPKANQRISPMGARLTCSRYTMQPLLGTKRHWVRFYRDYQSNKTR